MRSRRSAVARKGCVGWSMPACRHFCSSLRIDRNSVRRSPVHLRIAELHALQGVDDDLGNDEPGVLLVVCRHHEPWRGCRAGCGEARLIGLHVASPELPLGHVGRIELPVLLRVVDARQEPFALLVLRDVQEHLDDPRAIAVEVPLHCGYRLVALLPEALLAGEAGWQSLIGEQSGCTRTTSTSS